VDGRDKPGHDAALIVIARSASDKAIRGIRVNSIAPGAVAGDRIERVFAGRAQISGRSMTEVRADAMAEQSIKEMIDPKDIAQLAVFLASDAAKSISGQVLPIDNDRQRA
jgi:NAD(P)-dependent dehydrogenase (short-subunit alcohol dehydrogenase family)